MSFLAPLFLFGVSAVAIPIVIHLIQRERRQVVVFPSLMFLRRIPYQSVRRRRVRHWPLLLLRAAAVLLIVMAFARPFFRRGPLAAVSMAGAREVVVLLDDSASMGYGDHWPQALQAAARTIDGLGGGDRATLVVFSDHADERVRSTADRARLKAAVASTRIGSSATRFAPALKLAQSVLGRSLLAHREAVLISDFQRTGWAGSEDVHFPAGTTLTPVSVASPDTMNVAVASVAFSRAKFSGQERVAITAGVVNRSRAPLPRLPITLEINGGAMQTEVADAAPNASASVTFAPVTVAEAGIRGVVRAGSTGDDPLPQDNAFYFVLSPSRPIPVLVVEEGRGADEGRGRSAPRLNPVLDPSFYLSKALSIAPSGAGPTFRTDSTSAGQLSIADLESHAAVVLNNAGFPAALTNGRLTRYVERGGGLFVVLGERSTWAASEAALLPGRLGAVVDPEGGRSVSIGFVDYSHPVFELFKAPRSGDFSDTRVFRYRAITGSAFGVQGSRFSSEVGTPGQELPRLAPAQGPAGPSSRILARFDDGAVAAAETRTGAGRVIVWSTTMDESWNDLALKPIFLPLIRQTVRYLGRYEEPAAWRTVGQAIDLALSQPSRGPRTSRVVLTPSGRRLPLDDVDAPRFLELDEQGFYEIRGTASREARPETVAVNLDPAESDLTPMDPQELVAAVTGHAGPEPVQAQRPRDAAPEEAERRQSTWWYLLLAGTLVLAAETVLSNRMSRAGTGTRV